MSFLVLTLFLYASAALASPHLSRNLHHHHRALARLAVPPASAPFVAPSPQKRAVARRCKARTKSSLSSSAAPTVSSTPVPVANVGSAPQVDPSASNAAPSKAVLPPQPEASGPKPVPKPASKPAPKPASPPAPAPETPSPSPPSPPPSIPKDGPSFLFGTQQGQGTFYATGLGSCGITNKDTDFIAAVSHLLYDAFPGYNGGNPNLNPICGKKVKAVYQGKTVTVAITDRCEGCAVTDLDFSPSAFNQLADPSVGRISGMTWTWQ